MKKMTRFCLAFCLFAALGLSSLHASTVVPTTPLSTEKTAADPRTEALTRRLEEIKGIDKSQLSARERKALRKETREIKKAIGGGVYISAGLLIVLLVVLILVL